MKKMLLVLAMFLIPTLSHAQLFEAIGNPIVVAGATYQFEEPLVGNRAAFLLSANVAGMKLGSVPLYIGGVGVALPTTVSDVADQFSQFGNFVMLTVPAVTWYPAGNSPGTMGKVCLQAGYSYILSGETKSNNGAYFAVGYAWNSPAYLNYKRAVKKARIKGLKTGSAEYPKNPYDVE